MKRWSARHKWFERAEAYDADMARAEHEARRTARAEAAGDSELEAYREQSKKSASIIGGLGRAIAAKSAQALAKLPDGAPVPAAISSGARAAKDCLAAEADLMAVVVGVDDLIGSFNRGNDPDEE